jgi:hypothetical protein
MFVDVVVAVVGVAVVGSSVDVEYPCAPVLTVIALMINSAEGRLAV